MLKRIGLWGFVFCVIFSLMLPAAGYAKASQDSTDIKTVRVGYVDYVGYEEGGPDGHKTGYGYEYLQRIAYLSGWRYEYVYGSFSELFEMLQNGEIDLMGDISYTDERAEIINYSAYPMSKEYYYLVNQAKNDNLRNGNLSALNGKTIGVTRDSYQAGLLEEWLQNNDVSAKIQYLNGSQEVEESLLSGDADAIVITKTSNTSQYVNIAQIGYSEVYFGLSKSRPDLLDDINSALYNIQSVDPMYNDMVTSKYASYRNSDMMLSGEEEAFLSDNKNLKIGYLRDYLPLSASDRNGNVDGLLPDLTNELLSTLKLDDQLDVSYTEYGTMGEMTKALQAGDIDASFPFLSDYWYAEQRGLIESVEATSSSVSLVCFEKYTPETIRSLAVTDAGGLQVAYASVWFPECEIIDCDTQEQCLDTVLNKKADACLMLSSRAHYYLDLAKYEKLHSVQCPNNASFCFELRPDSIGLMMLLNRAISAQNMTDTIDRMNLYNPKRSGYSVADFVQEHPIAVFVGAAALILLIAGLFLLYFINSRRNHRALDKARNEALRASDAKSAFLFNMSHDIRTPMNAIMGFSREASKHIDDPDVLKDSLDRINSSSTYLLGIVNDILDMSQIDSGDVVIKEETVDLKNAASDALALLESAAIEKNQKLGFDLQIEHPHVITDSLRLRQIIINILDNAIKYTPEGGTIQFTVTESPCEQEDYAAYGFTVEDNGIGMSEEFQKIAFEPFTRERNTTISGIPGTGLGLSIVSNYAKLMNGEIVLKSKTDEGTKITVSFTFPTVEEKSAEAEDDGLSLEEQAKALSGKHILIVEDNELNAMLEEAVLTEFGMTTDIAENGRIAVDKLESAAEGDFDFVLMDIQMPIMDGYEATREIRQMESAYREIPIIALSANAFDTDKRNSLDAGMNAHLAKPLDIDELIKTLVEFNG